MIVMLADADQYDNFVYRYKKRPLSGLNDFLGNDGYFSI